MKIVVEPQITQYFPEHTLCIIIKRLTLRIYTTDIPHVDKLENSSDNNKEIHSTLQIQEQGSHLLHICILQIKMMPFFHIFHTYSTTNSNNITTDLYSANVNGMFAFWVSQA